MNKIACIYFEGNDSKIALLTRDKERVKILKAESIDMSLAFTEQSLAMDNKGNGGTKKKEIYSYNADENSGFNKTYLQKLNEFFIGEDVSKIHFIPILSEPAVYFQKIANEKELANLHLNAKGKLDRTIGFVNLYDETRLAVYTSGKSNYLQAIDSLARLNNKRYLKIPAVKTAEISLAHYVARKYGFGAEEVTLILYVGKEYSKIIFLKGEKLLHIGTTLAVGKNSFNAHNVLVSKILLEMERGSLSNIDNMIVCGEDDSDDLLSVIMDAYPRSKVKRLLIDDVEVESADSFTSLLGFSVPIAVAQEHFGELSKKYESVNLLPDYVKSEQKRFVMGWEGYLMMALLVISGFLFGNMIYNNFKENKAKTQELSKLLLIEAQNKEVVEKIKSYQNKISNVDRTKNVLNNLAIGTGILSQQLFKLSDFTDRRGNIWMSKISIDLNKNLDLQGYTFSRLVAKELSDSYPGSLLQNVAYEPIRDTKVYKFTINAGNIMKGGL
ncbi:MAG TPA: hypothetical protein VFF33_04705 [Ignavibacteriaceae bacterium]|nr:hypothetical protein [Ignavibacteriaceae bacterium]